MTAALTGSHGEQLLRDGTEIDLPGLEDALTGDPLFRAVSPEGLLVLTVAGAQLPARMLEQVYRFRLVQYLQRGWVDAAVVAARGLRTEPYDEFALRDFHTLVVERSTGLLRGYGTLAAARDHSPTPLGDLGHRPFVIERDYALSLADHLGPQTSSALVWEGKRLVRDYAMPRSQAAVTVPWWVYLAWAAGCLKVLDSDPNAAVVGDGKLEGAINQLRLLGFAARTLLDTTPVPPDPADLYAPMWDQEERSYPFILTDEGALRPTLEYLRELLGSGQQGSVRTRLVDFLEART
ncbi:hypothetical protein [Streptomyces sp. CBMA123]|uniref:hypothetical protein n=1 Tax=Streptomyces sp. CBMA123 TaxID=1896313 RepID=UPI0016621800|nr:hypothetical protein [Streptomyces sp. CBMA123]MBD0690661.1 hypothetical protein [Streptomyces sp. CBMA123]